MQSRDSEMEVEDVIKEYVAIDAVAEDIISDRHQVGSVGETTSITILHHVNHSVTYRENPILQSTPCDPP